MNHNFQLIVIIFCNVMFITICIKVEISNCLSPFRELLISIEFDIVIVYGHYPNCVKELEFIVCWVSFIDFIFMMNCFRMVEIFCISTIYDNECDYNLGLKLLENGLSNIHKFQNVKVLQRKPT